MGRNQLNEAFAWHASLLYFTAPGIKIAERSPLKSSMSTVPAIPGSFPLSVYCQMVQCSQGAGNWRGGLFVYAAIQSGQSPKMTAPSAPLYFALAPSMGRHHEVEE